MNRIVPRAHLQQLGSDRVLLTCVPQELPSIQQYRTQSKAATHCLICNRIVTFQLSMCIADVYKDINAYTFANNVTEVETDLLKELKIFAQ